MPNIKKKILSEISLATGRYLCQPEFLSLLVTFKCNFRCRSCAVWQKTPAEELSAGQWQRIADNLPKVFSRQTFIEINGGEPLLRYDLTLDLIRNLKRNFDCVTLNSNGLLIDDVAVSDLETAGLDAVKISFYSLNPDIHNELRGIERAYDGAKKALELIGQSRMKLEVGILITAKNIKGIPELIKYLNQSAKISIILQPLDEKIESRQSKDFQGNDLPRDLWPPAQDVKNLFAWFRAKAKNIKNPPANIQAIEEYYLDPESVLRYRCFAGQRSAVIYPDGDVRLCFKGQPIGNAMSGDLKKIFNRGERGATEDQTLPQILPYHRLQFFPGNKGIFCFVAEDY